MAGFIFRLVVCGVICLVPAYPFALIAAYGKGSATISTVLVVLLGAYLFVGMPLLWMRSYEWLERYGKRK